MVKRLFALLLLLNIPFYAFNQATILFEETYGGSGNEDWSRSIHNYFNTGYLLSGETNSFDGDVTGNHGGSDAWVVRTDLVGNILWAKCYGGNNSEIFFSTITDPNGDIISVGSTSSTNQQVTQNYGGIDVWVVKTDPNGNIIWQKSYGGTNIEAGYDIITAPDGSYIIAAVSKSTDGMITDHHGTSFNTDAWIFRVNSTDGSLIWKKSFGGTADDGYNNFNEYVRGISISSQGDSTFLVSCVTESTDGDVQSNSINNNEDYWIFKIDINGNLLFENNFGGSLFDIVWESEACPDGGFLLAGGSMSQDGDVTIHYGGSSDYDGWVVKIDSSGNLIWETTLGGSLYEDLQEILPTANGAYVMGRSYSYDYDCADNYGTTDIHVFFIDTAGSMVWSKNFGSSGPDDAFSMVLNGSGNVVVGGTVADGDYDVSTIIYGYDFWMFEFDDINSVSDKNKISGKVEVMPNPANSFVRFKFDEFYYQDHYSLLISNSLGQQIAKVPVEAPDMNLDISQWSPGVYCYAVYKSSVYYAQGKIIVY